MTYWFGWGWFSGLLIQLWLLKVGSNPVWTTECVGGPHVVLCTTSSIGTIGFVILDSTPCLVLFHLEPIIILTFNKVSSSPFEFLNKISSKFYFFWCSFQLWNWCPVIYFTIKVIFSPSSLFYLSSHHGPISTTFNIVRQLWSNHFYTIKQLKMIEILTSQWRSVQPNLWLSP